MRAGVWGEVTTGQEGEGTGTGETRLPVASQHSSGLQGPAPWVGGGPRWGRVSRAHPGPLRRYKGQVPGGSPRLARLRPAARTPLGPLDPLGPRLLGLLRRRWRRRRLLRQGKRAPMLVWRPPWPTCRSWPDSWRLTRTWSPSPRTSSAGTRGNPSTALRLRPAFPRARARRPTPPSPRGPAPSHANHAVGVAPASRGSSWTFLLHVRPVLAHLLAVPGRASSPTCWDRQRCSHAAASGTHRPPPSGPGSCSGRDPGRVWFCFSNFVVYFRAAFVQSFRQSFNILHPPVCSCEFINLRFTLIVGQISSPLNQHRRATFAGVWP
jgi:hypothetical protein